MEIKKAKWTDHLNAAEASGLGIAAYATQHGIRCDWCDTWIYYYQVL